jgi:hypothetical protein
VRKAHFVCNNCKAELESQQKAADLAAGFIRRWLRIAISAPRDKITNVPDALARDNTCCRCGTAVPNGGPVGSGAFYTEHEPTYGWPFCSCP